MRDRAGAVQPTKILDFLGVLCSFATLLAKNTCELPTGTGSVANIGQKGHKPGALDRAGDGVLAGGVAAGLAAADDSAVPVRELREQVEIFVVDVHRARLVAVDEDRVAFRSTLDVALTLVLVATTATTAGMGITGRIRHVSSCENLGTE